MRTDEGPPCPVGSGRKATPDGSHHRRCTRHLRVRQVQMHAATCSVWLGGVVSVRQPRRARPPPSLRRGWSGTFLPGPIGQNGWELESDLLAVRRPTHPRLPTAGPHEMHRWWFCPPTPRALTGGVGALPSGITRPANVPIPISGSAQPPACPALPQGPSSVRAAPGLPRRLETGFRPARS